MRDQIFSPSLRVSLDFYPNLYMTNNTQTIDGEYKF